MYIFCVRAGAGADNVCGLTVHVNSCYSASVRAALVCEFVTD